MARAAGENRADDPDIHPWRSGGIDEQVDEGSGHRLGIADRDERALAGPMTSGARPTRVDSTGRPRASASSTTSGPDSHIEVIATTSAAASSLSTSGREPARWTTAPRPRRSMSASSSPAERTLAEHEPPQARSGSVGDLRARRAGWRGPSVDGDGRRSRRGPRRRATPSSAAHRVAGSRVGIGGGPAGGTTTIRSEPGRPSNRRATSCDTAMVRSAAGREGALESSEHRRGPASSVVEHQVVDADHERRSRSGRVAATHPAFRPWAWTRS